MEGESMQTVHVGGLEIGKGIPKICVPILGKTEDEILAAAKEAKASVADLAELRIDWYEYAKEIDRILPLVQNVKEILEDLPLIFTFRTTNEGGKTEISQEEYEELNLNVLHSGCIDILDVEIESGDDVVKRLVREAHQTGVKIIASNHDFEGTPEKEVILKQLKRMDLLGADILKMAVLPRSKQDVLLLIMATLEMKENYTKKPIVTMSMGEEGLISRLSGEVFGSSITFGSITKASAPGQIPVDVLSKVLKLLHVESKKNIFFVGFMGAGKSTIAKKIAESRNSPLIEMDEELEQIEGMPIPKIFEQYGEAYFRDLESNLILELREREKCIVSCGGGVMLRNENIVNMKKNGYIIYLKATAETIYERVKDYESRPVLNGNMNIPYIRGLMDKRCATYEKEADLIVETDGKKINQICEEILANVLNIWD